MDISEWGAAAAVIAALVVITCVIISVVLQRRASRETLEQVRRTADAAALSAAAADRSSQAAEEAVGLNRETAGGVAQRVATDALAKRYQDAAIQLGSDKAAVTLAGAYAMARLADDWPEQRQSCVDVLCSYLRMPTHHETRQAAEGEKHVRITILRLIGEHLDARRPINWCDCDFDFSYAELPLIEWSEPTFREQPEFRHARFADRVSMSQPRFDKGIGFMFSRFEGLVEIQRARISGGDVALDGADIRAGVLSTDFLAEGSTISLNGASCRGEFGVACSAGQEPQGQVALREVLVRSGGALFLDGVDTEGAGTSSTSLPGAIINVEPEGQVRLPSTFKEFSGRHVYNDVWKN
ncbi:MAG TPA: hypothetical protein VLJ88_01815 [Propionibacteriaceae bacterium]|nr:hypothetical protein [Propionibacteriaceae bacterium]